jgi:YjbE family integral membrane protein
MEHIADAAFWLALGKIIWIDLLLSGDNAVVIALAVRSLPRGQRRQAIFGGSAAAVLLRVALTLFAVSLLEFPYLKIAGAALLFWIAVQLLLPEDETGKEVKPSAHLWSAVRTIIVADAVMSLDNVIAVAAVANTGPPESRLLLLLIGLGLSIPLIVGGSQVLLALMGRFPLIITLGAALLGFVAAEMLIGDEAVAPWFGDVGAVAALTFKLGASLAVVLLGRWLAQRQRRRMAARRAGND